LAAPATTHRELARARALQSSLAMLKIIALSSLLSLSLVTGCKKSQSECERVFDHTVSLMPAELQAKAKDSKSDALGKCEKLSPAARKCALDAKTLEDLMQCPRS
jgi:hypothetical protein